MTTPESQAAGGTTEQAAHRPIRQLWHSFDGWAKTEAVSLEGKSATELADIRTDLAAVRTIMAADRTLMAWVRTALSMLSFGFTIYKILEGFQAAGNSAVNENLPRVAGLFLSGMGTVAMVMGTIEYWQTLKDMHHMHQFSRVRPALIMALLMSVTGLFLFFSIITKLL